ncbi:MAG: NADP-dependent oxidoreductase [Bacteroidota bacterium]
MNKRLLLAHRPEGLPTEDTWKLDVQPIPEPGEGQLVVRNHYVSLDPAMRIWIKDVRSYLPPVQLGDVMRGGTIGEVIASKHPTFKEGMYVSGWGGIQQYTLTDGQGMFAVDPSLVPLPTYIGGLGMPGLTAYFGIFDVCKIKEGDVVLISGGAGAVGSVAGQIAKIKGCYVVGIAGGPEKCAYMKDELGFDDVIDYKNENIYAGIKRSCPKGMDVYFDNVGGEILDAALARLKLGARIAICGAISQYNSDDFYGPKNYSNLINVRGTMQGFLVLDYGKRYGEAVAQMGQWMAQGKLKTREAIYEGIENFNDTFLRLFNGDKKGKLVLKVIED